MDMFICNTCYITFEKIKKPFCLTECGHIYCQRCIAQAQKQCPRCHQIDVSFVELQEPSLARVQHFFTPAAEPLRSLANICEFQMNQQKIMLQRFHEINKKYEMLKSYYSNMNQAIKVLKEKYIKLKLEKAEKQKKLMSIEMHNRILNSSNHISTPNNLINERNNERNTRSLYLSSHGTNMSCQSSNMGSVDKKLEGFRIVNPQSIQFISPRPMNTRSTLHGSSNTRSTLHGSLNTRSTLHGSLNSRLSLHPSSATGSNYTFRS